MAYSAGQIVATALLKIGVVAAGEPLSADDGALGLQALNDMLDEWASRKAYVYATVFQEFNLVPSLSPHTIGPGPGATFSWNQVPVRIESAALVLNSNTEVDQPMNIRDAAWWAAQRTKQIATSVPTDLYYEPDQPNGSLFFWPVPNIGDPVRLGLWTLLAQLASLNTNMVLAPGYRQAITLSLAEHLSYSYPPREPSPTLVKSAMLARKAIQGNNDASPRIATADFGMPNKGRSTKQSEWNYYTGNLT